MKPYYEHAGITLYHGDCREILPGLGRFDLLLTDPPYGLGRRLHDGGTWSTNPIYDAMLEWDVAPVDIATLMPCVETCLKAIVWGGNYFSLPVSRRWLSWSKVNSVPTMADFELAWCSWDGNAKQFNEIVNPDGKRQHPTQKPLSLIRWCLTLVPDAQTILDPFAGSGTTLVAAKLEGRKAVGVEINERYCEIAAKRLAQGVLF